MKPTVSYVRGLRDVLDLNKEERRDYIRENEKSICIRKLSAISLMVPFAGSYILLANKNIAAGLALMVLTGIASIYTSINYRASLKKERMVIQASKEHLSRRKYGESISQGLEKDVLT